MWTLSSAIACLSTLPLENAVRGMSFPLFFGHQHLVSVAPTFQIPTSKLSGSGNQGLAVYTNISPPCFTWQSPVTGLQPHE